MSKVPTSVRVARWAAIAAAITACGSLFNTMWSSRPWWAGETAPKVEAHAPAPVRHVSTTVEEPITFHVGNRVTTPPTSGIMSMMVAENVTATTTAAAAPALNGAPEVLPGESLDSYKVRTDFDPQLGKFMSGTRHLIEKIALGGAGTIIFIYITIEFLFHRKKKLKQPYPIDNG
jgi:hypothetical protein